MSRPSRTWIIIADAARAKIWTQEKTGAPLTALEGGDFRNPNSAHHTRDLGSDRPGRSVESVGGARHAIQSKHDPRRSAAAGFASNVADFVEQKAVEKSYERLVIVAPPHTLNDFRHALGKHASALLVAEIHKDLTKTPTRELPPHLDPAVQF
jgi:protein required for attachment to host cells